MATLQKYFEEFHDNIRLRASHEREIAEKRDIVVQKVKAYLKTKFDEEGLPIPQFEHFDQGSYAMDTGILPIKEGDYDIDVGLLFKISASDYPDPVTVKRWILEALENHTSEVCMKEPCVTVNYMEDDEIVYHVDLAIYADANVDGRTYLARGDENSEALARRWEPAEPQQLIELMRQHFGDDGGQFRRIIKYLKRWKDMKFTDGGNAAPLGIGITIAAYNWFQPSKTNDSFTDRVRYDDHTALKSFLERLLGQFAGGPLHVSLPVEPHSDLFGKMTDQQMQDLREELKGLLATLIAAGVEPAPEIACEKLRKQFGNAFPVPEKSATAEPKRRAIVHSNSSASA